MKIKKSGLLLSLILIFLLVIDYQCFCLVRYPYTLRGNSWCFVVTVLGALLAVYNYCVNNKYDRSGYNLALKHYFLCIAAFLAICFYSFIKYPSQPIDVAIVEHISLLYVGLTIPFLTLMYKKGGIEQVMSIINIVVFIWYLLLLVQSFVWKNDRSLIFLDDFFTTIQTRSHGIRIGLRAFGNIAILYNFDQFFHSRVRGKKKLFYFIQCCLGLFCLVCVQQTRAFLAVVLISLAVIMIVGAERRTKKTWILFSAAVLLVILAYTGVLGSFLKTFNMSNDNIHAFGTTVRIEAIAYYFKCFTDNIIFGNGFANYQYYPTVQYGPFGTFYYSDVGVFGLLAETGLMSVIFYIVPLIHIIRTGIRTQRTEQRKKYAFWIGMIVYLVGTSISLLITDSGRALAYPLVIAMDLYICANLYKEENI